MTVVRGEGSDDRPSRAARTTALYNLWHATVLLNEIKHFREHHVGEMGPLITARITK
jgi:hypothetical protein